MFQILGLIVTDWQNFKQYSFFLSFLKTLKIDLKINEFLEKNISNFAYNKILVFLVNIICVFEQILRHRIFHAHANP